MTIELALNHPWQLLAPRRFPRRFYSKTNGAQLMYLGAIFVDKEDATKYSQFLRWKELTGIRVVKLQKKVQIAYGMEYLWGVWNK